MITNIYGDEVDLAILAPEINHTDLVFDDETGELSWTKADGEQTLVIASEKEIDFLPFNNVTYPQGSSVKDGIVVYRGKGSEVNINSNFFDNSFDDSFEFSGLPPGEYYIYIFAFNGTQSNEMYFRVPLPRIIVDTRIFDSSFDETFE